ncbi:retrovirus-related Pol polyprotein from transposon 412 [Trichonephila clavipes]|nr:retrovirus-related Pol polyprotein from transposon 412 [Trichonephila clavipes]
MAFLGKREKKGFGLYRDRVGGSGFRLHESGRVKTNNRREPEEQASDYEHIREVLLKRFKLSADKFRQLLVKTQKNSEATWYDLYHELKTFLDGWLNGLKIETFEQLRDLMLVDQIKRRAPNEFKEHFLDEWATITSPKKLGTHFRNHNDARNSGRTPELNFDKRKRLQCYECGSFNYLRPQCPNLKTQKVELCRIGVKSEGNPLDPYTSKGKKNGFRMSILRDTGATVDVICQKYVNRDRINGEHAWVRHLLDDHMTCLPVAEVDIECDLGRERERETSKAAVIENHLDQWWYILGNQTAALLQGIEENCPSNIGKVNAVVTHSQTRQSTENNIFDESDQNEQIELNLEEGTENSENEETLVDCCSPINTMTQIKPSTFIAEQQKSKELAPIIEEQIKTVCHDGTSGYLGVLKTKDRLLRHFFWPKCYKEIEDFVKTCDPCQRVGKTNDRKKAPLVIVPVISEVFSKINVDACGHMPISTEGNKYLITVMCLASKYPDAIPVPDITSKSVVNALLQVLSRMGFPREIQTDQRTSFMSRLTVEFFNRFGIKVSRSSVHHPQSNPVERFHRTVKRILRVLCIEAAPNFESQVPAALFALRTVTHENAGFSPAELVYGNNLRTPVTLLYESWLDPEEKADTVVEYVFELINRLKKCVGTLLRLEWKM